MLVVRRELCRSPAAARVGVSVSKAQQLKNPSTQNRSPNGLADALEFVS